LKAVVSIIALDVASPMLLPQPASCSKLSETAAARLANRQ
jgi:hypothetical protein